MRHSLETLWKLFFASQREGIFFMEQAYKRVIANKKFYTGYVVTMWTYNYVNKSTKVVIEMPEGTTEYELYNFVSEMLRKYDTVYYDEKRIKRNKLIIRDHVLFETGDKGAPDVIKDSNGEVVLGLCKICGKGECQLSGPCIPSK